MADRGTAQRLDVAVQQPTRWVCHAACRNRMDLFIMPTVRRGRPRRDEVVDGKRVIKSYEDRIAEAKAICRGCPVLELCRAWALTDPDPAEAMIAGGLTFVERVVLRRASAHGGTRPAAVDPDGPRITAHGGEGDDGVRPHGQLTTEAAPRTAAASASP